MSGTDARAEAIEAAAKAFTAWEKYPTESRLEAEAAVDAAIPHLLAPIWALTEELVNHGRNAQQTTDGHMLRKMLDAIESEATSEGGRDE